MILQNKNEISFFVLLSTLKPILLFIEEKFQLQNHRGAEFLFLLYASVNLQFFAADYSLCKKLLKLAN